MANQPYNRTPFYPLEKPLCDEVNQGFSQVDRSLRETLFALLNGRQGFLDDGFLVQESSPVALSVDLLGGVGFQDNATDVPSAIDGVVGLDDLSRYKPIILSADLTVAVPAPPGANSRIDLIEVRYNRDTNNPQSRNFLNPGTNAFAPANVDKTLDFNVDGTLAYYAAAAVPTTALAYKSGVAAVSPVAPATDTGYMALAHITVATGVLTIVAANIAVVRSVVNGGLYLGEDVTKSRGLGAIVGDTGDWTYQVAGIVSASSGIGNIDIPLTLGDRIKSVSFSHFGDGVVNVNVTITLAQANGTLTAIGFQALLAVAPVWATTTINVTDTTMGVGDAIVVTFAPNAANLALKTLWWTHDHPNPVE